MPRACRSAPSIGDARQSGDSLLGGYPADRSHFGGKLYGGYSFTPNFSLEAGYADLGRIKSDAGRLRADSWFLDAVGTLPLGNDFSLLGSVGVIDGQLRRDLNGSQIDGSASASERGTGYKLGAGLQYDFTKSTSLRAEWEHYRSRRSTARRAPTCVGRRELQVLSPPGTAPSRADATLDPRARHAHDLARADLAGLAQLVAAVDLHLALGDHHLGAAAARREAGGLQQRVERDVLAAQLEIDQLHWDSRHDPAARARTRARAARRSGGAPPGRAPRC